MAVRDASSDYARKIGLGRPCAWWGISKVDSPLEET
jgi:hypothetical protein